MSEREYRVERVRLDSPASGWLYVVTRLIFEYGKPTRIVELATTVQFNAGEYALMRGGPP